MDIGLFRYIEVKCWSGRNPIKFEWVMPSRFSCWIPSITAPMYRLLPCPATLSCSVIPWPVFEPFPRRRHDTCVSDPRRKEAEVSELVDGFGVGGELLELVFPVWAQRQMRVE